MTSVIDLVSILPDLPESGGFFLNINGRKRSGTQQLFWVISTIILTYLDFVVKQVRLKINGDEFWKTLSDVVGSKIIATFRLI